MKQNRTRDRQLFSARDKLIMGQIVKYFVLIILTVVILIPIYWMLVTSFKMREDVQAWPPAFIPTPVSVSSYIRAFEMMPVSRFFFNSIIVAIIVVASNVVFCSLAAYTLARKKFRGADAMFNIALASMMIPTNVRVIPMYQISMKLGLDNTHLGMAMPILVTGFGIFLMRQFFMTLPKDVEDAASIDGCNDWGVLFRMMLPMSRPAMVSLAIFAFVWTFEDFLWPLIVTSTTDMRPLQVGITLFQGSFVYEWGPVMATASLTVVPMLLFYVLLQKYFVMGMTSGAVKG